MRITREVGHTAGPWQANEQRSDGTVSIVADKQTVAMAWDFAEAEANARLIAAAPELLEALRRAVPWLGKMIADGAHQNSVLPRDCEIALTQAEAAIAKAEGRE